MDNEPYNSQTFLGTRLPCGHDGGKLESNCAICGKFEKDAGFRAVVRKHQGNIKGEKKPPTPSRVGLCRYISDEPVDKLDCNCAHKWRHECEIYGTCCRNDADNREGVQSCETCPQYRGRGVEEEDAKYVPLIIKNVNAPGDTVAMTAAIDALHKLYPGEYVTDVESPSPAVWEGNPNVKRLTGEARKRAKTVVVKYDGIHKSDDIPIHFLEAYCWGLSEAIGRRVVLQRNTPFIRLRDEEKAWIPQVSEEVGSKVRIPYVVVNAGHKHDLTAKFWGRANFQKLVDQMRDEILFVQVGERHDRHTHEPIKGALDLIGQTDQRQLIRMVYHAKAAVGPSTFIQHIAAAVRTPYVLIAGGREPVVWQYYPGQLMLSSVGSLPCCQTRACWRSRVAKLDDGEEEDGSVCDSPVMQRGGDIIPKCLAEISVDTVAESLRKLLRLNVNGK